MDSLHADVVTLQALEPLEALDAFAHWLVCEPDWIGGFDFPFGRPMPVDPLEGWIVTALAGEGA